MTGTLSLFMPTLSSYALFTDVPLRMVCVSGLWDIDPEDSAWYHLEQRDKNDPSKVRAMDPTFVSLSLS